MPDEDIFDGNKDENKDDTIITNDDDDKGDKKADQLLTELLNDDGTQKYKTIEEALKAAAHAQKHISTIESENAELKEKGNASDKLDELLQAVKQSQGSGDGEKDSPTMKPEDVLGIVKDYFDDTKAAETRQDNIDLVTKIFKDRYGKDASEKLYGKTEDLGLSRKEINSMIANNPNAALKVLGIEAKQEKPSDSLTTKGSFGTEQFRGTPDTKPKSIMGATKTGELDDAWKASKARTLKRLNLTED